MLNLPFIQFGIYPNSDAGQHMVETILEPERDARRDAGSALVSESGDALDFLDPSQLAWPTDCGTSAVDDIELLEGCGAPRRKEPPSRSTARACRTCSTSRRCKGHRTAMSVEERNERRREGNRRAAQRLRARRMATVAELRQKIMSLEGQKQSFLDDIRQLTSGCQLVVAENQLLRNRLKFLQCRRQGKENLQAPTPTSPMYVPAVAISSPACHEPEPKVASPFERVLEEGPVEGGATTMSLAMTHLSEQRTPAAPMKGGVPMQYIESMAPDTPPGRGTPGARPLRNAESSQEYQQWYCSCTCGAAAKTVPLNSQQMPLRAASLAPASQALDGGLMLGAMEQYGGLHTPVPQAVPFVYQAAAEPSSIFEWVD